MSIISRILKLNEQAERYEQAVKDRQQLVDIRTQLNAPAYKVPVDAFGVHFNEEGAETGYANAEVIDLGLKLPASRVGWQLRAGKYRLQIRTASPGTLSAYRLDGTVLFKDKRFLQYAVVDLDVGEVNLVCSEPILNLSLVRLTERTRGEVILGPFSGFDGIVSVHAVGHGSWSAEVGYDSMIEGYWSGGQFIASGNPPNVLADTRTGYVHNVGGGLYTLANASSSGAPWSVAHRFLGTPPRLGWTNELPVGLVPGVPTSVEYTTTREQASGQNFVWAGMGTWTRFSAAETPSMSEPLGQWTYVWGRAVVETPAVLLTAYDVTTGRRITADQLASIRGFYLIEVQADDDAALAAYVTVTGTHGAYGSPLSLSNDPRHHLDPTMPALHQVSEGREAIPPGSYDILPVSAYNRDFLIRVRGTGILRAVDITIRTGIDAPDGTERLETFRESLAEYWNVEAMPRQRIATTSGRGLYLPHV